MSTQPTKRATTGPRTVRIACCVLLITLAGRAAAAPADGVTSVKPGGPRPNILFCIADDWSWPHAGAYGDRVVKTPTFDRLAAQGVRFTNAFCAAPSCSAS